MANYGGIAAKFNLKWNGDEYSKACRGATVESIRLATKEVAKVARQIAPRAPKHRMTRKYPRAGGPGVSYSGEPRISRSIVRKVVDKPGKNPLGFVKAWVGYAVFVNYGHKIVARDGKLKGEVSGKFFMQRALIQQAGKIMDILKGKWPK